MVDFMYAYWQCTIIMRHFLGCILLCSVSSSSCEYLSNKSRQSSLTETKIWLENYRKTYLKTRHSVVVGTSSCSARSCYCFNSNWYSTHSVAGFLWGWCWLLIPDPPWRCSTSLHFYQSPNSCLCPNLAVKMTRDLGWSPSSSFDSNSLSCRVTS